MAVATRTITSLVAPFTQTQLSTALQAAFINAGFSSIFDSYTSGTDLILVYAFVVDGTKTFGTSYLRVRITNTFIINQALYSTWNATAHTGTNASTEAVYLTLLSTASVTFNAFNASGEVRLVLVTQGTLFLPLGMICPVTRRGSWDLSNWNWGFIFIATTMLSLRSTGLNQYSNAENDIVLAGSARLATANVQDNERDLITGIVLLNQSNTGFPGRTSDDLAIVSSSGSTRYDTFTKAGTSQQFLLINPGSGGLALRII
jgi:hypothetical protein